MKKNLAFLVFLVSLLCNAQRQGNIWYFEGLNGLDFNSGSPALLLNGQIPNSGLIEGTATISDSLGNLLFYGTAQQIWNKNHQPMQNGTGLMGGESATQGIFIVPLPGSDSLFYVFTLDQFQNCFANGLRYSVVNMCLGDGMGGIDNAQKNIFLLDSAGEKMAGTYHSNGTDVWLVVHKYFSNAFYAFLVTSNGISSTVISHIGSYHPADSILSCASAIGQMKISPDGSKLALVNENAGTRSIAELFDFDNTTGIVSNVIDLQPAHDTLFQYYGVSFSPDNSKLYVTKMPKKKLFQYDLSSGIPANIVASRTTIHTGTYPMNGLQLGPDGRIYVVNQTAYIDVIPYPNNPGLACGYIPNGQYLVYAPIYSLPNFIDSYAYKNGIPNCKTNDINEAGLDDFFLSYNIGNTELTIVSSQNATIEIFNINGQIIKTLHKSSKEMIIETGFLRSGVYLLKIITDKEITIKKFIRE